MKIIEGDFATPKGRFAIVAGRFNGFVVEPLVAGARDALVRHGVKDDAIELIRVPGAWEIALAAHKLANSADADELSPEELAIEGVGTEAGDKEITDDSDESAALAEGRLAPPKA